ncbi:MAG: WbuC family cupin fold metalloprotein, partial [Bacteroidales bacterium]|nr:WbuC family cupin fold metalloprotein [Bacteroidales bacterium]
MIKINEAFISVVSQKAKESPRKRINFNFHKEDTATLQRMLNAMEPGTYIRPHKHENPDKVEAFFALRGRIL